MQDQRNSRKTREPVFDRQGRREPNLYKRQTAAGLVYEVSYRDSTGRQVLEKVRPNLTQARDRRDEIRVARNKGERVQANPGLRFSHAAERWLEEQVSELRPGTQAIYRNAVTNHLLPRWGGRRMDAITVTDAARLVRDMRADGKSEWTMAGVLKAAGRIFKFAARHLNWHGQNPIAQLEKNERPKVGSSERRRIYEGSELEQTLTAAHEPYKTLFALAATTGARLSEILGLTWADITLDGEDGAEAEFLFQVDRKREAPAAQDRGVPTVRPPRRARRRAPEATQAQDPAQPGSRLRVLDGVGACAAATQRHARAAPLAANTRGPLRASRRSRSFTPQALTAGRRRSRMERSRAFIRSVTPPRRRQSQSASRPRTCHSSSDTRTRSSRAPCTPRRSGRGRRKRDGARR